MSPALRRPNASRVARKLSEFSRRYGLSVDPGRRVWQLSAGEQTLWFEASNLNLFWRICDNTGDDLTYITQG